MVKSLKHTKVSTLIFKKVICQPQLASLCATSSSGFPAGGTGPFSLQELIPQQEFEDSDLRIPPPQETPQSINAPHATRSRDDGSRSSTDSPSVDSTGSGEILKQ